MGKQRNIIAKIICYIDVLAIISTFGILLYRVGTLRVFCKNICLYITEYFFKIDLQTIKSGYLCVEKVFRTIIAIFLIVKILQCVFEFMSDWRLKKCKGQNRFENSLFRYLHETGIPRCFLVTGQWGSGKTYDVQHFFEKYFYYSRTKVFRISCFGIDSRRELIQEISSTIEKNDKSFYSFMIKSLQFVPIIGNAIEKLFKKNYGYESLKRGSVFVFDDFERITARTGHNRKNVLYQKSSRSNIASGRNTSTGLKLIEAEFEKIDKSFRLIEDNVMNIQKRADIDKYNIIIGLINDLIETYGMKVIIICNSEVLDQKFVYDFFRSKLNCIEYKKHVSEMQKKSVNCSQVSGHDY